MLRCFGLYLCYSNRLFHLWKTSSVKAPSWKQKSKNTSLSFQSHLFLGLLHHPSRICSSSAKDFPPWSFILTSFFSKSLCETVHRSRHVTLHDWPDTGAGTIGNLKKVALPPDLYWQDTTVRAPDKRIQY